MDKGTSPSCSLKRVLTFRLIYRDFDPPTNVPGRRNEGKWPTPRSKRDNQRKGGRWIKFVVTDDQLQRPVIFISDKWFRPSTGPLPMRGVEHFGALGLSLGRSRANCAY